MDPRVDLAHNRTAMANYRTQLAMDRTALAWIRTSLTFATFGLGMVGFTRSAMMQSDQPGQQELHRAAIGFGGALVLIGITAMVLSSISYWKALKRLRRNEPPVLMIWPLSITVAVMVALLSIAGLMWIVLS